MGILSNLRNLAGGAGRTTVPLELLPGEQEVVRVVASARPGGASVGGELVLTTHRICFVPWNTRDIAAILAWALPKADLPRVAGNVVNAVQRAVDGAAATGNGTVAAVVAGSGGSVLKPPTIMITSADGSQQEFGVLASIGTPNRSPRNRVTRDNFIAAARGVPTGG